MSLTQSNDQSDASSTIKPRPLDKSTLAESVGEFLIFASKVRSAAKVHGVSIYKTTILSHQCLLHNSCLLSVTTTKKCSGNTPQEPATPWGP